MSETDTIEKLYVFGKTSRSEGTNYPRMALVPDGMFDPSQRMKLSEQGVISLINRDELPDDLSTLPQPERPEEQRPKAIPVVAIEIQAERVRRLQRELTEATGEMARLQRGGIPNTNDEAVRGGATPDAMDVPHNSLLPDAPSPLDGDRADAAATPVALEGGAARVATAPYGGESSADEPTRRHEETVSAGSSTEQEQNIPPHLR